MYERGTYFRDENGEIATLKNAAAELIYAVDFSDEVAAMTTETDAATLSLTSVSGTGVTVMTSNLDGDSVVFKVSGGTAGEAASVLITYHITAGANSIKDVVRINFVIED